MTVAPRVDVELEYSREFLEAAAKCFVRQYLFQRQGRMYWGASATIAVGSIVSIFLGANTPYLIAAAVLMALAGPLYVTYLLTLFPRRRAARLAPAFAPSTLFSFTTANVEMSAKGKTLLRASWAAIPDVWDCPSAFLIVISVMGVVFIPVPKEGLPPAAGELLAAKARVATQG